MKTKVQADQHRKLPPRRVKPAIRTCLSCGDSFASDGPGHRRCSRCKQLMTRRGADMVQIYERT